jgi:hypothetical protein
LEYKMIGVSKQRVHKRAPTDPVVQCGLPEPGNAER